MKDEKAFGVVVTVFYSARSKLEDSRTIFEQLKQAMDAMAFKALFNSFLNSSRAITYALQKEGKKLKGFNSWYEKKQEEMKNDQLLRFIHEARTEDFHEGKHRLNFATHIEHFSTALAGQPPTPNAAIGIGGEGPFWIVEPGTARERRIPIRQGGKYTVNVSIQDPPSQHKGTILFDNSPINICWLALNYFSELIEEAIEKFS
jgi:hypothetical protein